MNAQDLKNSILQLAIQGKLVEQRPEEGTADVLIRKIKAEKASLIEKGIIRKEKPFPEIEEDEIPFEVPENWEWIRFGDLGSYKKGPFGSALTKSIFVPKGIDTVKVYEQKHAIQKSVDLGDYYISREYFESKMKGFELSPGDIIVSCAGTIGETFVMPDEFEQGIINQALMLMKLMPSVCVEYFLLYFDFILKKNARKSSKGSAIKNIPPFQELKNYVVPLPPIEEQERIIAKIEELMPYVDQYDKAYSEVEELNKKFPEDMQKSILQYAIQGKLVEQREEEGTAEELYQEIQDEKKRLIEEGKIKKTKALPEISEDEIPFDIPESWKWVRLGDVIKLTSGQDMTSSEYNDTSNGIPYLTGASNIINGELIINRWTPHPKALAVRGDILLTCKGTVGKTVILDQEEVHIARQLMSIRPIQSDAKYIQYFLNSYVNVLKVKAKSMIPGIERKDVLQAPFPLPPLNEQKRIVEKIEVLLPYMKRLIK